MGLASSPISVLEVREAEGGARRFCSVSSLVRYSSRNSIYGVTVTETWSLAHNQIHIEKVQSAPIVLDYYGIVDYRVNADGIAEGSAPDLRYEQVRIKVTPGGAQKLIVGRDALDLIQIFAEGTVVIVSAREAPRVLGCWFHSPW